LRLNNQIIAVGTTSLRTIESLYWMGVKALDNPQITLEQIEIKQWDPYTLRQDLPEASESISALLAWMDKHDLKKIICKTSILIAPPYVLKIAKGIVTNFHQPQSTLLLLVAAIIGEEWRRVYDYALNNGYRFLSYGDSSLLLK